MWKSINFSSQLFIEVCQFLHKNFHSGTPNSLIFFDSVYIDEIPYRADVFVVMLKGRSRGSQSIFVFTRAVLDEPELCSGRHYSFTLRICSPLFNIAPRSNFRSITNSRIAEESHYRDSKFFIPTTLLHSPDRITIFYSIFFFISFVSFDNFFSCLFMSDDHNISLRTEAFRCRCSTVPGVQARQL